MLYIYENDYAIGYMDGDRFVRFLTPLRAEMVDG